MVVDELLRFFGQMNFAMARTTGNEVIVLKNTVNLEDIYVVLLDNSSRHIWTSGHLLSLNSGLMNSNATGHNQDNILYLLITDNIDRDKAMALAGMKIWFINSKTRQVLVFENQPDEFFGLRSGIISSINETAKARTVKTFTDKSSFPYMTGILIAVNIIYFFILVIGGRIGNTSYMLKMGANFAPLVFQKHEFWRLITSMFMHFSLSHLAGNMIYLGAAGFNTEKYVGHFRFFLIYMLSGIGASVVSAGYYQITHQNVVSAGASGAVYGLIAMVVYLTFRNRGRMQSKSMFLRIGFVIVFLFYSNFVNPNGVDVVAHIGGFIFGILLSILLIGSDKNKRKI